MACRLRKLLQLSEKPPCVNQLIWGGGGIFVCVCSGFTAVLCEDQSFSEPPLKIEKKQMRHMTNVSSGLIDGKTFKNRKYRCDLS
jgi:hypothetical protein